MDFIETRGSDGKKPKSVSFSNAILEPSASFGGLYVPSSLPKLEESFFSEFREKDYDEMALFVLQQFGIDIEESVIKEALKLYRQFDNPTDPAPLKKLDENLYVLELYHGPTRAFKDMALVPFGYILSNLAKKRGENYLILAATSGDTGPATLDTFKNRDNTKVACLYPVGGTSDVQRLQMTTESAPNLKVLGIHGDFDDAQNALKSLLADGDFLEKLNAKNIKLSAANSVNFGRIIFQIIYHVHAYLGLLRDGEIKFGEKINIIVPSGNFGNALGAFYAKMMGVPVDRIVIASNKNSVLSEHVNDGKYDLRDKKLQKTISPAMDILKSSNVERILYELFGAERTKECMERLARENHYELTSSELAKLQEHFSAVHSDDEYAMRTIKERFDLEYMMDPHTATAFKALELAELRGKKCVICSTAEWTKFAPTVLKALRGEEARDKEALMKVSKIGASSISMKMNDLFSLPEIHKDEIEKEQIKEKILGFVGA